MNRLWFLLSFLCIAWAARGQSAYEWRYWFDDDGEQRHQGTGVSDKFNIDVITTGLAEGFHFIHVQVADTAGKFSPPQTHIFYNIADRSIKALRYWFDTDTEHIYTVDASSGLSTIDVSRLIPGTHIIYCQAVDALGMMTDVVSRFFYRQVNTTETSWTYWFDNDAAVAHTIPYTGDVVFIDVAELAEGFHTIHHQVTGYTPTDIESRMFLKIPQTENAGDLTCLCIVDGKIVAQDKVSPSGGILAWNMDVNHLSMGIHKAMFQVVAPSGSASTVAERYFVRTMTNDELGTMKCVYSLDNTNISHEAGTLDNGLFHFDLDVAALDDGLHRIAYWLVSDNGISTPQHTAFFWKTPLGGEGIVQYDYWVNNNDGQLKSVKLDKRVDPLSLIALLPVDKQPIRSSNFHFAVKNGTPLVYARNDFHIRFYDIKGRYTEEAKEYVDEQVSDVVEPVGNLQATQTFDKVAENSIRWYTMQAAPGDTAAFRLSQAATVQVFAPSGKEVFKTSGAASVKWGGIHTWEDGTYYLAVHDVTGSQNTMTINFMHMDKYDVVDWDVHTVGNGGCSTITFRGNGFSDLYAVDLYTAKGDTIHSADISHDSDAETAVTFDFTGAELDVYDAVFHFTTEDKVVSEAVTVEEAADFDIETKAIYASSYLSGTANRYTFKIRNNSNMTAYHVPMPIHIYAPNNSTLKSVEIGGYDVKKHLKNLIGVNYTDSIDELIDNYKEKGKDLYYFLHNPSSTERIGFPHLYHAFICPDLRPNTTETFTVSVTATGTLHVYMWCSPIVQKNNHPNKKFAKRRATVVNDAQCGLAMEHARQCEDNERLAELGIDPIYNVDCPPPSRGGCPGEGHGGPSSPAPPVDPNDIYGYLSEAGSRFIADSVAKVNYTIEFENDTTFAKASAHTIILRDTLDAHSFDLTTFLPTALKLGGRDAFLNDADVKTERGVTSFVTTIDVRPEINAIAQVEGMYSQQTGIAEWRFTSLDPMTMEPTDDLMQGILPVNYDGTSGIGEVMFEIGVKPNKGDGTKVPNRAGIVFDYEEVILTPTWVNTVDATAPTSHVTNVQMASDTTVAVSITATDALSGPWRYDVYVQYGSGAGWWKAASNVPADTVASVRVYEGIDHGFYVVATDSAGNVERKDAAREFSLEVFASQVDTDTKLTLAQGWNWVSHNQQDMLSIEALKPKALRIVSQTDELYKDERIGWVGSLTELSPTSLYKVQAAEAGEVQLSGRLFNAAFRTVPLYEGWNWMGYPVANAMSPSEALQHMEAEEGDFIVGQDGMATYTDGQWMGTLTALEPGVGYMYRSVSDKQLFLNATAQYSVRRNTKAVAVGDVAHYSGAGIPEVWTVDKHKYPNVMCLVADLYQDDEAADASQWLVAAFCGEECRGLSQAVGGHLMMNVYGTGGERITFLALHRESGEVVAVAESETFRKDILGSMHQPYVLHSGLATGIYDSESVDMRSGSSEVYDLQGRRMATGNLKIGVYILTDSKNKRTQKVLTK